MDSRGFPRGFLWLASLDLGGVRWRVVSRHLRVSQHFGKRLKQTVVIVAVTQETGSIAFKLRSCGRSAV